MSSARGDVQPRVQQTMDYATETGSLPYARRAGKLEWHSPQWGSCGSSGTAWAKLVMREWLHGDSLKAAVWKRKYAAATKRVSHAQYRQTAVPPHQVLLGRPRGSHGRATMSG